MWEEVCISLPGQISVRWTHPLPGQNKGRSHASALPTSAAQPDRDPFISLYPFDSSSPSACWSLPLWEKGPYDNVRFCLIPPMAAFCFSPPNAPMTSKPASKMAQDIKGHSLKQDPQFRGTLQLPPRGHFWLS